MDIYNCNRNLKSCAQDSSSRAQDSGSRAQDFGSRAQDFGSCAQDLVSCAQETGFTHSYFQTDCSGLLCMMPFSGILFPFSGILPPFPLSYLVKPRNKRRNYAQRHPLQRNRVHDLNINLQNL